jgi:anaerobic magnesium-protoporphyrin IX monomethyl ester cyclase
MKVLLLIPPTNLQTSYGKLKDFSNPQPSIGIAYMAAVLRERGFYPAVMDCYATQTPLKVILQKIREDMPDIIGLSCLSSSYDAITEISQAIRQHFPLVRLVGGNLHASLFAEEMLRSNVVDYILHREGDYALAELCQAMKDEAPLETIRGLSFHRAGKIVHTEERPLIDNLDALPFPAWDMFPRKAYRSDPRTEILPGQVERQILATRGCPNACTFCSSRTQKSLGSKYRMRSPVNICDEMEYMHEHYGSRVFTFMDLAFPLVKKHAMGLFHEMVKRGLPKKIKWSTECRVKPMDREIAQGMRESGCVRVNFGIESGNDEVLKSLKKNFCVEDVHQACTLMQAEKIEVDGMFMLGLPDEREDQIEDTIRLAVTLPLRYAIFNLFVPYPGSELYDVLSREGKIHFIRWADFTSYGGYSGSDPVYVPKTLTKERLLQLQKKAMHRFYFNPRFIWGEITRFRPSKVRAYISGLSAMIKE